MNNLNPQDMGLIKVALKHFHDTYIYDKNSTTCDDIILKIDEMIEWSNEAHFQCHKCRCRENG